MFIGIINLKHRIVVLLTERRREESMGEEYTVGFK